MKISEIAKQQDTSILEITSYFQGMGVIVPDDLDYELSNEQVSTYFQNYHDTKIPDLTLSNENAENTKETTISENVQNQSDNPASIDEDPLEKYYYLEPSELLDLFKKHNSINNLLLEGTYERFANNEYGFFRNVTHQNGNKLSYPFSNIVVNDIYIGTNVLAQNTKYLFEVTISKRYERINKSNPFLLEAKKNNINEVIEQGTLSAELSKLKNERLDLENKIRELTVKYEAEISKNTELVSNDLEQKTYDATQIILNYSNEIERKEFEYESLSESVTETQNNLQKMVQVFDTLKSRVEVCKRLQFISEEDEKRYMSILNAKEYKPENHFDFKDDFNNNFSDLADHIHAYLYYKRNLIYTQHQIKNFLTLLRTNDIIVLSGLSGSGKTQIVKAFAEAIGGVAKIIPVKPNWTSSEDLVGYFNPLQMSFLPTPFTEAIVEAINNPLQIYLICLDEMNLARAEYYFADFLSKLEERSKQPEIELYASHEEELFISEFSTLLNLIESSIGDNVVNSWQEFIGNDAARTRFFEMLGNTDKDSMLQLHSKMKRRLIDILKFPSTIKIPENVRFIGAINVDETTHYFSPKILDRVHIVKFENPLLIEDQVNDWFKSRNVDHELLQPVYVQPLSLSRRTEYPSMNNSEMSSLTRTLKKINQDYLLPLSIDFGVRSIRQALNYADLNKSLYDTENVETISLNTIILQKILPRFIFDGNESSKLGKAKHQVVEDFINFMTEEFKSIKGESKADELRIGTICSDYLLEMKRQAEPSKQYNFFA